MALNAMQSIEKIGKLQAVITRLSDLPRKVAIEAEPGITRLLKEQFAAGTDPYGRPWARLRPATIDRGRTPPPLTDTAVMRGGTKAMVAPGGRAGLRLVVGAAYGYFQQVGTRYMTSRRILPQLGLPATWRRILDDAARACAKRATVGL